MTNKHLYSLSQVNLMLDFMLHELDCAAEGIFRISGKSGIKRLFVIFSNTLFKCEDNSLDKKSIDVTVNTINGYNLDLILYSAIDELNLADMSKAKASTDIDDESQEITCYDWSDLCKEMIQHGNIIEQDNIKVFVAWRILACHLKNLYIFLLSEPSAKDTNQLEAKESFVSDADEFDRDVQNVMLCFLGQLLLINQRASVQAIHNFIHLIYRASLLSDQNKMDTWALSKMVAPCLVGALELSGKVVPEMNAKMISANDAFGTLVLKREDICIANVVQILLRLPHFHKPFSADAYQQFSQENYEQELKIFKDKWQDLWKDEIVVTMEAAVNTSTDKKKSSIHRSHSKSGKSLIFSRKDKEDKKESNAVVSHKVLALKQSNSSPRSEGNEQLSAKNAGSHADSSSDHLISSSPRDPHHGNVQKDKNSKLKF